jgi:hypothetical protein
MLGKFMKIKTRGRCIIPLIIFLASSVVCAENTTYFVDEKNGSDVADGLSEAKAWKTLAAVNAKTFEPGDEVLFKAGGRWVGQLWLKGAGSAGNEIRVGLYGEGARPRIAGEAVLNTTVSLNNGQHWIIEDLEITNQSVDGSRRNGMSGIKVYADAGGDFKNITLRRLHVHHVSGDWDRQGGRGIDVGSAGGSRYDGLLIEDCFVHDVSFYGILISGWGNRYRDARWFPNLNVVVRNNFTRDTGGDSIVVISCEDPLIEHNEAHRCAIGQSNGGTTHAAGMWPHSSDGTIMRYNKVKDIDAAKDGQAFDVDINCRNTLIEYNWTEGNTSGFLLMCSPDRTVDGTFGIVVRNNLSINDGLSTDKNGNPDQGLFKFVSDVKDITIENNAFVNNSTQTCPLNKNWRPPNNRGWKFNVLFTNNIFSTPGGFTYVDVDWVEPTFENNTYVGTYNNFPADSMGTQTATPAVLISNGVVSAAYEGSTFQSFDVSTAGLLATNPWFDQLDLPPNTAPSISAIANQFIAEDGSTNVSFTLSDDMTPTAELSVSAVSSNTDLVPESGLVLGGSGANRTLTITPATGESGVATITVTVDDGHLLTTESILLRVGGDYHPALMLRLEAANYDSATGIWADSSGFGNHAIQYTAANRPALFAGETTNGAVVVRFDGGDHLDLTAGISTFTDIDGYTAFVYLRPEAGDDPKTIFGGMTGSCQYRINANETQHLLATWTGGTGGEGDTVLPTGTSAPFSLISAQINSAGGSLRLNGSADGSLNATTFTAPIISIGRNGQSGSEHFSGDIAEIRIYNRQLTELEIAVVEGELDATYGTGVLKVIPNLSIALSGSDAVLSWTPAVSGWVLQETENLSSNWIDCASGSLNPVTNSVNGATMFYRLREE